MTCRSARRQLVDLFDAGCHAELREHLAACGTCAAEFEETLNALSQIEPTGRASASPGFKQRTMSRLAAELRTEPRPRPFPRRLIAVAALLALVVVLPYLGSLGTNHTAANLLAQSVQALNGIQSVHILARMRTSPGDNFEFIGTGYGFQPVEMWKEFGATPRWRMENPGRVVVMDGRQSTLFIKPDRVVYAGRNSGFVEWLRPLLDPEQVLSAELREAQKGVSHAAVRQDGPRITLTAARKAQGDFTNDWTRNTSVAESDHTRVYRFDASTGRLTGLQVIVHDGGTDTVVFEITEIRYNESIAPELFTVALPDNVISGVPPDRMPVNQALPATARDAAVTFLEGMAQRDWDRVLTVYPATAVPPGFQRFGGGLQIVSIGQPFQSGLYPGWFVPYEVQLADGTRKKWNLAVRNDNPARRWIQDGGF
ncbi:MAG: hypothetical protein P4L56_19000 [Candidatus Sulfopaludibacter sp.]|nr:hypothetical protein [Candidatus Sulfopaludibacter sp.]